MNIRSFILAIGAVSAVVVITSCGGSPAPSAASSSSGSTGGFTAGGSSTGGSTTGSSSTGGSTTGGNFADGPGPVVGNLIPASVRYPAMDKVTNEYKTLLAQGMDQDAADQKLLQFVQSDTDFTNSGIDEDGSVWARFPDNTYYIFNGHTFDASQSGSSASLPANFASSVPDVHAADAGVPVVDGSKAILFDTFDGYLGEPIKQLTKILQQRGYSVQAEDSTLENLKSVNNVSVLFSASHGLIFHRDDLMNVGSMWTDTEASASNDALYADDIKAGRLAWFTAASGFGFRSYTRTETHYAITPAWIKYYNWSFTPHSVAFLDFCWSDAGGIASALRSIPKPASLTFGWSNECEPHHAWRAGLYFFDRALGTGFSDPTIPLLKGKGRPFPSSDVFAKMVDLGFNTADTTDNGPSHLVMSGENILLAPSVANMETYDPGIFNGEGDKTKLIIHGNFGTEAPSKVTVGGTSVTFNYVNGQELDCDIPDKPGPGYAGPVQISTSDGVTSNAPSLTWWSGSFKYTGNPVPTVTTAEMDIDANFRCDIHKYRTAVDGDLQDPAQSHARTSLDTVDKWSQSSLPPGYTLISSLTGTYSLGLDGNANKPWGTGFDLEFYVDRKGGTIKIAYSYLGTDVLGTVPPETKQIPFLIPGDPLLTAPGYNGVDKYGWGMLTPNMDLTLNTDDFTTAQVTFIGSNPAIMNTTFVAPAMTPQYAPTSDAEEDQPSS